MERSRHACGVDVAAEARVSRACVMDTKRHAFIAKIETLPEPPRPRLAPKSFPPAQVRSQHLTALLARRGPAPAAAVVRR
jgi:hypothetical protein